MRKHPILILWLCLLVLLLTVPISANDPSVTLRIEGASDTIFFGAVPLTEDGTTLIDLLQSVNSAENGITIEGLDAGYITAINGEKAGRTTRGWDGFGVRLNGDYLLFSALSSTPVQNGDEIVVYYADEFGEGLMIPQVDDNNLEKGELRFFAEIPNDDGTYTVEAIVGAEIRWYCGEAYASYVTDAEGKVQIDRELLLGGDHRVGIEMRNSEGIPLVLRLSPDYTVNIPTDVGDSPAVYVFAALALASACAIILLSRRVFKKR